jgi:hypothetical protein
MGAGLPSRGGSLHPPRPEPRRRRRRRHLGRAQGRLSLGSPRERRRTLRRRRRASRRRQGCGDGHTSGGNNVRRAPEEKEARIFHPEVGDYFSLIAFLVG